MKYTKAIRNGKLRATEMAVGDSVTGTIKGTKDSQYGPNLVLEVQGREVEIYAAGNLKFFSKDVQEGKKPSGVFVSITRTESKNINGRETSQFDIQLTQASEETSPAAASVAKPSVKQQLDEIRAKRG